MRWKNCLRGALYSFALSCPAQDIRVGGPIAGLVFDGPSQSLRQVVGMPGAALLGGALLPDVDWASAAPSGQAALVVRQGEARLFSAGENQGEVLIQGTVNSPLYAAWAADSSAVALYSAVSSSVQWIRLTQQGPIADPPVPLPWAEATVTAFAADEKSGLLILAVAGRGVYRAGASGDPVLLLPIADIAALALESGGQTLWISDRATAQLLQISTPQSNSDPLILSTDSERLADVSAMALSSDRKRLYLADRSTRRLYMLDRSSASLSEGVALDAPATLLVPLGRPSVFLLGQRTRMDEPLYILDDSAGPAVFFVPVMEDR
jgi:hypothetical protein